MNLNDIILQGCRTLLVSQSQFVVRSCSRVESASRWCKFDHYSHMNLLGLLLQAMAMKNQISGSSVVGFGDHHANSYFERLGLDPLDLDPEPSLAKLQQLQEAHLGAIPFENLAQHGAVGGRASVLDLEATATKVLKRKRGGFCFELNGLFAAFLTHLGYKVTRVPAYVYAPGVGFRPLSTHMTLIVTCSDERSYFVDVGFGEPPLHPLSYEESCFSVEQQTPEGMCSKFLIEDDFVVLHWKQLHDDGESEEWLPRLKWKHADSILEPHQVDETVFVTGLEAVHSAESPFTNKLICCSLNREIKRTIAGHKLKITGPPRFGAAPSYKIFETTEQVRHYLEEHFGVPFSESEGLDLEKSIAADSALWSNM